MLRHPLAATPGSPPRYQLVEVMGVAVLVAIVAPVVAPVVTFEASVVLMMAL